MKELSRREVIKIGLLNLAGLGFVRNPEDTHGISEEELFNSTVLNWLSLPKVEIIPIELKLPRTVDRLSSFDKLSKLKKHNFLSPKIEFETELVGLPLRITSYTSGQRWLVYSSINFSRVCAVDLHADNNKMIFEENNKILETSGLPIKVVTAKIQKSTSTPSKSLITVNYFDADGTGRMMYSNLI